MESQESGVLECLDSQKNAFERNTREKEEDLNQMQANADAGRQNETDKDTLLTYVHEATERLEKKAALRSKNLQAAKDRPELNTALLDSSLKKNTAYIKKLRNITESQQASLERELLSLNLSRYLSEAAQAITDAKLKMADVPTAVQLCSLLHQRYQEFSSILLQSWQKAYSVTSKKDKDEKQVTNLSKLRVDLRFYAELITVGVFTQKEGLPLLGNILTTLVNSDKDDHQNLSILITFCKHCGEDYIGLPPRRLKILSEKFKVPIPKSDFLTAERQKNVCSLMKEYFASLISHLIRDYHELQQAEKINYNILKTKGELSDKRKDYVESLATSLSRLMTNAQTMADLVDEDIPEMPQIKLTDEDENSLENVLVDGERGPDGLDPQLWEDEDSRAFYTNLPQLKVLLPSILYTDSEKTTTVEINPEPEGDITEEHGGEAEDADFAMEEDVGEEIISPAETLADDDAEEGSSGMSSSRVLLEGFINSLPQCISRDLIDAAALEFCLKLNTKPYRKRLARALFLVPRTRLDLLPFYARLTATLHPLMPDVANDLVNLLKMDFRYQVKKKDQINIESKIKIVRFIGELVKFGIFPRSEALLCLKMLLHDFSHHHIEMACNLVETCGRYLFRNKDSHYKMKVYLDQMMRKKAVKSLDSRHNTMIENAYYYVNPPDVRPESGREELTPLQQYIQKLLYHTLNKANSERVLRQLRKLNWEDQEIARFAVHSLTAVWNAKFYNIRCIANVLAGLIPHHDWIGPAVVDGVLEDIRLGMEVNESKFNQRRLTMIRYLGELYNYRVIESLLIFKVLYSLITFGVNYDPENPSEYDPPDHLLRVRLVCELLMTCGQFFSSGASRKRLDCFLTYFQHYYQFKRSCWAAEEFPWQIEHLVQDTFFNVRPKLHLCPTLLEAQEAVSTLSQQMLKKALQHIPYLNDVAETQISGGNVLPSVIEDDDNEGNKKLENIFVEVDEEDEELELNMNDVDADDWSEGQEESLTPSQHSLSQKLIMDEEEDLIGEPDDEDIISAKVPEEEEVSVTIKHVKCKEDDDFMTAFDKMLADNMLERTREQLRPAQTHISVPTHVKSSAKKTYEQLLSEGVEEEKSVVNFVLLTRFGNKQQFTNVEMPIDSELVLKLKTREEEEKAERDHMKQLTLEINERQEEEEALEMLQQTQRPPLTIVSSERRLRYQHQKGAPDADLIFGPKRVK